MWLIFTHINFLFPHFPLFFFKCIHPSFKLYTHILKTEHWKVKNKQTYTLIHPKTNKPINLMYLD